MEILPTAFLRFVGFSILSAFVGTAALAESLPKYQPALLGHRQRSLVNLINTESLMKRGQKDAIVLFSCGISRLGNGFDGLCYRESPNSDALQQEVVGRLEQAQFEPAVYNHHPVPVYLSGMVSFFVRDGKPHLRVFLHQEEDDLQGGKDFVAPQFAFVPGNTKFKGIYYPPKAPGHTGAASVKVDVAADGRVQGRVSFTRILLEWGLALRWQGLFVMPFSFRVFATASLWPAVLPGRSCSHDQGCGCRAFSESDRKKRK